MAHKTSPAVCCVEETHTTKGFRKAKERDQQTYAWQAGQTESEEMRWIGGKEELKPKSRKLVKDGHISTLKALVLNEDITHKCI